MAIISIEPPGIRLMKRNFLKNLAEQLSENLPSHLGTLKKDFEKNCQRVLHHTFDKLDLVTREEFDLQSKVLQRTRKQLDEMEAIIKEMEATLKKKRSK
jgi:BMFP domain-containing protein YqiC